MSSLYLVFLISILLSVFLIFLWRRAASTTSEFPSSLSSLRDRDACDLEACPVEYIPRIFSKEDWEFIAKTKSPILQEFFRCERRAVALLWVQQTLTAIHSIMDQHIEIARQSTDLVFATEAKIFFQYARLRFVCAALFVSILLAGPQSLCALAIHADRLSRRLEEAQHALQATFEARKISGVEAT